MATSPQGPGWWQASDGQWYPPESHPSYRPPYGPQPQSGQFRQGPPPQGPPLYRDPSAAPSSKGKALLIAAIVVAVLLIAGVVVAVVAGRALNTAVSRDTPVIVGARDGGNQSGGKVGTDPGKSIKTNAPDATGEVDIVGPANDQENAVVSAAIVDIQKFWSDELPKAYGEKYQPVEGGFYSWSPNEPLPPCVDSPDNISGNAFYCDTADVVAWDDTDLIPHLYDTYGDLSVAVVFAHEWGHAVQARVGMRGATVTLEQQADCFAGAWVGHVRDGGSDFFTAGGPALDQALAGYLEIADEPGTSANDENAHGSAFDRINSFQEGLGGGAAKCKTYTDQSVGSRLVELEFTSQKDFDAGGNAPYADHVVDGKVEPGIISLATADLEDYWSQVARQKFNVTWKPLAPAKPFDGTSGDTPKCGGVDTSGYTLFYCDPGRFIAYDNVGLFPEVYDSLGDFAVGALYGSQYSLAAQSQFDDAPDDARAQNLMADCMTGSWAASVFRQDRTTASLQLSPGDLDEAVKVLLALGSKDEDGGTQGTGFERVQAFRDGVIDGVKACSQG